MTDKTTLDLSDDSHSEQYVEILSTIADLMLEMADPDTMTASEREQNLVAMEQLALAIMYELDLTIVSVNPDGTATVSLRPKGIEA